MNNWMSKLLLLDELKRKNNSVLIRSKMHETLAPLGFLWEIDLETWRALLTRDHQSRRAQRTWKCASELEVQKVLG